MPTDSPRRVSAFSGVLRALREHFRPGRRRVRVTDASSLADFIDSRASYVAQASLYGYLRTRAGARYLELVSRPEFAAAMNVAKWQLWLACVSDLAVYAGGLVRRDTRAGNAATGEFMRRIVATLLERSGTPAEAGPDFDAAAARLRERVDAYDWSDFDDGGGAFTESPAALVRWAPILDELKALDEDIVRNSVRFRWQEVRRELRDSLDAGRLAESGIPCAAGPDDGR